MSQEMQEINVAQMLANADPWTQLAWKQQKYFIVRYFLGKPTGWVPQDVKTWDEAVKLAHEIYTTHKRSAVIYVVADLNGAENIGRVLCNYPYTPIKNYPIEQKTKRKRKPKEV